MNHFYTLCCKNQLEIGSVLNEMNEILRSVHNQYDLYFGLTMKKIFRDSSFIWKGNDRTMEDDANDKS